MKENSEESVSDARTNRLNADIWKMEKAQNVSQSNLLDNESLHEPESSPLVKKKSSANLFPSGFKLPVKQPIKIKFKEPQSPKSRLEPSELLKILQIILSSKQLNKLLESSKVPKLRIKNNFSSLKNERSQQWKKLLYKGYFRGFMNK
jgi:hypothetical protein